MFLLKVGAYLCLAAGVVLLVLAYVIPAARLGLLIGAIGLFLVTAIDLWFYRYFTPVLRSMPKPPGTEDEDPASLRGALRMNQAVRQQGLARMESATTTLKEMNRANHLRQHGLRAKAEVLAIRDTQQLVNFDPILEFDLKVHPEQGDLYHVSGHRQVVSKIVYPQIEVGGSYDAFVDPEDPDSLIINWQ